MTNKPQDTPKERGCWLTGWLILMLIHGILSAALIAYVYMNQGGDSPLWLGLLLLSAIAIVVAAVAIWYWQRWGLILYAVAIGISIVIGLVLTRTQLWVFHEIIPLAILGYLIKDKWADFGMGTE
jgi:hypothetical protein